ncbi:MAG: hypothetical protein H6719_18765 [Sandaracinaceae bacterium]|nr:hypothetical protein [Sandaracinaceae bacterium]
MLHGGRAGVWIALALVASAAGCQPRSRPVQFVKPALLDAMGPRIEAAAAEGPAALAPFFDWDGLAERSAPAGLALGEREGFLRGVRESLGADGGGLVRAITDGRYSYRGVAWRDGHPVARFRFLPPAGGFNFHDLVIVRTDGGEARVVDMFVMTSSEYVSDSMRRIAAFLLGDTSSVMARIFGDQAVSQDDIDAVRDFNQLAANGDANAALAAYDALAPRIRQQRAMRLLRVQAASRLDDQARYLTILNETAVNLPGDPALSSMMLDAHYLSASWDACLADLTALRLTYDDPYIDAFEGRVHVAAGDHARALALADRVIAAEDSLIDGHDVALLAALGLGQTDRARHELDRLVAEHGVDPARLASLPGYEGVASLPPSSP